MKNRAIMFALVIFFVSSLAFADSPTDAPLKPNDDYAVLLHPERSETQNQDVQNQDAQTSHKRKRSKKNDESVSSKSGSDGSPKANRQEEGKPGNPGANGKFAGSN